MSVSELILSGFQLASEQQDDVVRAWIAGSHRLGGTLPDSLLCVSLQRAGRLDALIRCMEDEYVGAELCAELRLWMAEPLASLSETWIGHVYEIVRLSQERKLIAEDDFLKGLAHDFRLLRVTMEKHEIAQDRRLTEPLLMSRAPEKEGDLGYRYDKNSSLRAHVMPSGISLRGSMQWLAIDISAALDQRWIERRDLSDRFLHLLRAQ